MSEVQIALDTVRAGLATAETARTLAKEVERLREVERCAADVFATLDIYRRREGCAASLARVLDPALIADVRR